MQLENLQSLVGKTIKSIEESAVNCKTFFFTDGSVVTLEPEGAGYGLFEIVGYEENEMSFGEAAAWFKKEADVDYAEIMALPVIPEEFDLNRSLEASVKTAIESNGLPAPAEKARQAIFANFNRLRADALALRQMR